MHITYLHDGDPLQAVTRTVRHRDGTVQEVHEPLGKGVHRAYEDGMMSGHRQEILDGLSQTRSVDVHDLINDGFLAAQKTIELMRDTYALLPPSEIVQTYVTCQGSSRDRVEALWNTFGRRTIEAMQNGTHLVAILWESAWVKGRGQTYITSTSQLSRPEVMQICAAPTFLESLPIAEMGTRLERVAV